MSVAVAIPSPLRTALARWRQRIWRSAPADDDAVVLRHSRIYMLPTLRGAAFLATLFAILIASLNYNSSLGLLVIFLLGGLAASALLHTFRNLAGLELAPLAAGETFAGAVLPFALGLSGGAVARYSVSLAAKTGERRVFDIPAEQSLPIVLELPTSRRGRIALGRVTLSSDYPLGLWRAWAFVHFPLSGIAFPAPEIDAPPLPTSGTGPDARTATASDAADLAGLRGYQPGDPMQRVAWKAVARGAGWYSKQFEGEGAGGPTVLEWHALNGLGAEARLARMTAWVLAAERIARPFALALPGVALPAGQGRDHRRAALTGLALHEADDPT